MKPTTLKELADYLRTVAVPVKNQEEAERAAPICEALGFKRPDSWSEDIQDLGADSYIICNDDDTGTFFIATYKGMKAKKVSVPELEAMYAEVKENETKSRLKKEANELFPDSPEKPKEIDWEQRRFEIASKLYFDTVLLEQPLNFYNLAANAKQAADALVEELKK